MAIADPDLRTAAFDGTSVGVDYAAYLGQHDVVYGVPPRAGEQAMPIGDGDLGAMMWCPEGEIRFQFNKSDLWFDSPYFRAEAPRTRDLLSAGALAIVADPAPTDQPIRFEQRLNLYHGLVSLESDAREGACSVQAWAAATGGVVCIQYRDCILLGKSRSVQVRSFRNGHPFAIGDYIGVLESLPGLRFAFVVRLLGAEPRTGWRDSRTPQFNLTSTRGVTFTLLATVAVTEPGGDPISAAKARLDAACRTGVEHLLRDHRIHWRAFWRKSFLRLSSPDGVAKYVENLWYVYLYQLASSSRGMFPPLPSRGLWSTSGSGAAGGAIYRLDEVRTIYWPTFAANHLELLFAYDGALTALLGSLERRTAEDLGIPGLRVPPAMSHAGEEMRPGSEEERISLGLECALPLWWCWEYARERDMLRHRTYPLLREVVRYYLGYAVCRGTGGRSGWLALPPGDRAALRRALALLLEASEELEEDEELRGAWAAALVELGEGEREADWPPAMMLLARQGRGSALAGALADMVERYQLYPQGFCGDRAGHPDQSEQGFAMEPLAQIAGALNEMLVHTRDGVIYTFPALPPGWEAAFMLRTPGGARVMAESTGGITSWVAIESLVGARLRVANPWEAATARVTDGRTRVLQTDAPCLDFPATPAHVYVVERADRSLYRTSRLRLRGSRSREARTLGARRIGLP